MSIKIVSEKQTLITRFFWVFSLIFAILKILLVGGEEIVARYQPLDDFWQIMAASRGYWFSSGYDWMMYVHLPIYSFWVGFVHITGVPLRIATEILFLGSSFLFVVSLRMIGISVLAAVISYALLIFHPASFQIFNYTLAGTLYSSVFLVTLASIFFLWVNRHGEKKIGCAVLVGVCFAILWHIRKENVLLMAMLFVIFAFLLAVFWREKRQLRQAFYETSIIILIPILIILSSSLLVKTFNLVKFGLFVSTEMDSPGYKAAYKALLRIKPDKPIRFVPVPKDVRYKAYSVSPSFRELKPFFEGEFGEAAASETRKWMGIEDEIAAGWFYWALKNAAVMAGHHNSATDADDYFHKIADEINLALDNKEAESRFVLFTFLDPEISNWLPYLPGSIIKIRGRFLSTDQPLTEHDSPDLLDSVRNAFNIATNRRISLLQGLPVSIQGWVFSRDAMVTKVEIQSEGGDILGSTNNFTSRPDVASSYSINGYEKVTENSGIKLLLTAMPEQLLDARFVVRTNNDGQFDMLFRSIKKGRPYDVYDKSSGKITFAFDEILIPNNPGILQKTIKSFIWEMYGKILNIFELAGLLVVFILIVLRKNIDINSLFVLGVFGTSIFSWGILFALVDSSSWPGDQARYLFPVMQIYGPFLFLLVFESLRKVFNENVWLKN